MIYIFYEKILVLSEHTRFRMANGLLYRLFEEAKDWIIGFIHRENFL